MNLMLSTILATVSVILMAAPVHAESCGPQVYCYVTAGQMTAEMNQVSVVMRELQSSHERTLFSAIMRIEDIAKFEKEKHNADSIAHQLAANGNCIYLDVGIH